MEVVSSMTDILLEVLYVLIGGICLLASYYALTNKEQESRVGTTTFWAILGITFIAGKYISKNIVGILIIIMALLAAFKQVKIGKFTTSTESFRTEKAEAIGNKLFIPALAIAVFAFGIAQFTKLGGLVGLGIGAIVSLILAIIITKSSAQTVTEEGGRLLHQVGPASILPQLLAALGALFNAAGVGEVISGGISRVIPQGNIMIGITAYCIGMAVFTIIMGNAFAAFAVITAGIGVPFVLNQGADPAIAGMLALTAGYCGTLMTPMAANFNVVPAAILEINDKNRVIKKQIPVALTLLIIHIILMRFIAF